MPGNGAQPHGKGYAIETRAETLNVRTGGNSIRRGELDELHTGNVERLEDAVYGEEKVTVSGELTESVGQGSTLAADTLGFTVNGRLSISAIGWPENKLSGEDAILLGGAMAETWTAGALIAAAMSDDLIVGGGVRITAPLDVSMNHLTGIQEQPGTGTADVVFRELYGTLFEREYGPGTHNASVAMFSATVYQTQRAGFRPLMKTALGVRNLIPGGAPGVAPEPSPPAPPAAPPSAGPGAAGAGTMVAANMGAGAAGTARGAENFQDMGRVAGAAEDMQNAAALHRAEDTADTLDELANAARFGDPDAPEGAVNQGMPPTETTGQLNIDGPYGQVDDLDNPFGPIDDIDEPIAELMNPVAMTDVDQSVSGLELEFFPGLDESAAGGDSLNASDASRLLDVDTENLLDRRLGEFDGSPLDSTHIESPALESPAVNAPSAAPSLDDSGAGWSVVGSSAETSPGAAVDASSPAQPNYQHMPSRESGVSPGSGASPGDPQAVADASVYRRAPDDFDCIGTQVDLERVYYEHREASNWRGLEAYGVVNDLREDLRIMVANVGGEVGDGQLERLYAEIRRVRGAAVENGNVARLQSIDAFFDWYDLKVYDAVEDLTHRADEFNDALTGGVRILDPNVDSAKLQQWLLEQSNAALLRVQDTTGMDDSLIRALGREGPYFQQMWLAIEEGRDPLVESLDQIAYLRSVNNQQQVREYMNHHRRLLAVIADPEFRIADVAQNTDLLRPGLESTDGALPVIGDNLRTTVLDAELTEPNLAPSPGGTGEAAAGDFGANHQILEGLAGPGDLARPPANQPHWMGSVPLRRILFPTGDPGFEHLLEGSLTSASIADTVESSVTAAEDDEELLYAQDLAAPDSGFLGPPRFGDVPAPAHASPLLPGAHWSRGYRKPRFGPQQRPPENHVGNPFRDHDRRRIQVAVGDGRQHG